MDSSSRFEFYPIKLDLVLQDTPFYFRQATKVFRLWANKPNLQKRTVDQLRERGTDRAAAEQALGRTVGNQ